MANKQGKISNSTLDPSTKGLITNAEHYVLDTGSWSYLENFSDDKSGVIRSRIQVQEAFLTSSGYQGIGFYENAGSNLVLLKSGTDLIMMNPASPTTPTTLAGFFPSPTATARFSQIQGVIAVASPGMIPKVVDASGTLISTISVGSFTGILLTGFAGRVWGVPTFSGGSPLKQIDEIYYTDVMPQDVSLSVITGGSDYLKINTKGRALTALIEENNTMYAFTNESIFRIYNTQAQDNAPIANVGTFRQETVVRTPVGIFFMGNGGIYRLSDNPEKISYPIDDFFYKMNILRHPDADSASGNPKNAWGWADENSVYFVVGMDSQYSQLHRDRTFVIKYNFFTGSFSIQTFYGVSINCAAGFNFSTNLSDQGIPLSPYIVIAGKDLANLQNRVGYLPRTYYRGDKPLQNPAFLGDWSGSRTQPIFVHAQTNWLTFGAEYRSKEITGISIASKNAAGCKLYYQIDKEDSDYSFDNAVWEEVGTIKEKYITFFRNFKSRPFYRIRFKISGASTGTPIEVGQITFFSIDDKGYGE